MVKWGKDCLFIISLFDDLVDTQMVIIDRWKMMDVLRDILIVRYGKWDFATYGSTELHRCQIIVHRCHTIFSAGALGFWSKPRFWRDLMPDDSRA